MGDLNDIIHPSEKFGPSSVDFNRMNDFCAYVKNCGLIDLGFNGPAYTWSNKRFSSMPTYERLDRCRLMQNGAEFFLPLQFYTC
jgi:hypothetical protein